MGNQSSSKLPPLSRSELDALVKKTSLEAREIKSWYKVFYRECPDGQLTKAKFLKLYTELSDGGTNNVNLYEHIFRTYDKDGSGHIDFGEFIEAINITRSSNPEDKLRMAFRLYDLDQNGCIEEHEMIEVMKAVISLSGKDSVTPESEERIRKRAKTIFDIIDQKKQGYITVDELVYICLRHPDVYNMVISAGAR